LRLLRTCDRLEVDGGGRRRLREREREKEVESIDDV
jgi:hypothetical protein